MKANLENQRKFNRLISEIISQLDIEDKEFSEDREESDQNLKNLTNKEVKMRTTQICKS